MALNYRVRKTVFGFDETKTERYVAQPELSGTISYDKVCEEVNARTGVHRGLVGLVAGGLIDVMCSFIEEGMSVKLGEMGTFRPSFSAKSDTAATRVAAGNITRRRLVFTPGKMLKSMLADMEISKRTTTAGVSVTDDDDTDAGNQSGNTGSGGTGGGESGGNEWGGGGIS